MYWGPVVFVPALGTQQACLCINSAHVKHSSVDVNFENNVLAQDYSPVAGSSEYGNETSGSMN
jgi:hypothetical protein